MRLDLRSFFDDRRCPDPDPVALLTQLRSATRQQRRAMAKLRIYFGASAGVGKTYAMLSAAQREKKDGQ